jgi:hypothetical protein
MLDSQAQAVLLMRRGSEIESVMTTGIGPGNTFLCFSTAFKRRRWEVGWDTGTALELQYIGT